MSVLSLNIARTIDMTPLIWEISTRPQRICCVKSRCMSHSYCYSLS